MKIQIKRYFALYTIFAAFTFSFILSGCGKQRKQTDSIPEIEIPPEQTSHSWFYFTKDGFSKVDKPQNVPQQQTLPWTEALRISSTASVVTSETSDNPAYAIVNRLGILNFNNDKVFLSKDYSIFTDRTADNLLLFNDTPVFSVYKSAFFNDTITYTDYKNDSTQHLFLLQYDPAAKICYPLLNCNNLTELENSEVIDFDWDGLNWICSIKTISDTKNSFSYIKWHPTVSLLNLSPGSAKTNLSVEEITQDAFRSSKELTDYQKAPERIKNLLTGFSRNKNFEIEIQTAGGTSPEKYTNTAASDSEKPLIAKGILAKSWSAALFEDGTLYLEGALPGKHILRNGKPVAIRLPKLPAGFVYSNLVISGSTLYAAWEESSFYNTGRSGFLQVNLDKTLYSKIL